MTTLQVEETVASQSLPSSPTRFKLDIFSDDQWTHSIELPAGKCTIGSSPSCQVRLAEEQVRPLHCLLVHGCDGVTATSWSPGMLLNDQEFTTAPLYAGDKLSIGSLQLKLAITDAVDSELPQDAKNTPSNEPKLEQTPDLPPDPQPCQTEESSRKYEVCDTIVLVGDKSSLQADKKLAEINQQSRNRCRSLIASLRQERSLAKKSQQEAESYAERWEAAEQERNSLAAELEQLRTSFAEENRSLAEQLQALEGERDWLSGEVEQLRTNATEEVRHLTEQLHSVQGERELLAEELEEVRTNTSEQIHQLSEQLQVGQAERESLSHELEQLRNSSTERDSQQAAELDRVIGELSAAYEKTSQLEAALNEAEARSQEAQRRIDELSANCDQFTESTHCLQEEKNQLSQQIAEQDNRIAELEHDHVASLEAAQIAEARLAEQIQGQNELSDELAALRKELSEAKTENARLKEESEDLQRSASDYQQLLQCAKEELRVTVENLERHSSEQEDLRNELSELRTEREQYSDEKAKLINEAAEQRNQNELLEIDVKSLTSEWQQSLAEITRLKKAEEENLFRIEELEEEQVNFDKNAFEALRVERDQLSEQLRSIQEDIDAREELLQNASQRLEQLHAIVSESEEAQAELNEDIAARIGQIELLTGELDDLRANVIRHEEERKQFSEKITDRENTIEQLRAEFDELRASIALAEQERDNIAQSFASQESQLIELTSELEGKRAEIEAFSIEREQHATSISNHESQIDLLSTDLDTLRTKLEEVEQERNQLVERLASQESESEGFKAELEELRSKDSQIDEEQEEYFQCIAAQVDQIEELTSQLETVHKKFSLVEQERDHVAKSLAERESKIEQLTADLKQSQELLTECSEQAQQLNVVHKQTLAELEQARGAGATDTTGVVKAMTIKLPSESEVNSDSAEAVPTEEDSTEYVKSPTVALTTPIDLEEKEEQAEPSADFQPPSFIDQYSHLLDENGFGQVEERSPLAPESIAPAKDSPLPSNPLSEADGEDDGDLEAYMSNLMRRVRGEVSGVSNPHTYSGIQESSFNGDSQIQKTNSHTASPKRTETEDIKPEEPHGLLDIADLKATSSKPSQPIDLASMRELANTSARSAIAKHSKRRHFEGVLGKFLVSSIAGGTATAMIASAEHFAHPLFLGGCAVGVVSIYWGFKLIAELLEMIRDGGAESKTAEFSEQADSLPIDGGNKCLEASQD
ncbi:FHA domain-containing protein [Bythopirellula goksoeyrii]|nr:FHA domain-containing protein [Bythopirellula goksoeyrii]